MPEDTDILEAPQTEVQPDVAPDVPADPQPDQGPGPKPSQTGQPALKDADKQRLVQIIQKMESANEPEENIRAVVKRFQEVNTAAPPSPVDKGVKETGDKLNESLQFNGTFQPDLEGEKKGLYLNDPDYQKQKQDFTSRILTDEDGRLNYPEKDNSGNWYNAWSGKPLLNFDPAQMEGKILQVPHNQQGATNGKQFITPKFDQRTGQYTFPGVETPTLPTEQTLPEATVYGAKKGAASPDPIMSAPVSAIAKESEDQGGQFKAILKENPDLAGDIDNTLKKYGPEYVASLGTGAKAMTNVLQKTIADKYNLNAPLPSNVDGNVLNSHLDVLNNFDSNRKELENKQTDLQHQADLIIDKSKRTGQPVDQSAINGIAQKHAENIETFNNYTKAVNFAQNYVNQPEVKEYLREFQKRRTGMQLMDEINQRSFPKENEGKIAQDEFDRKAIEGNYNVLDFLKTATGRAVSGLSNMAESGAKVGMAMSGGLNPYTSNLAESINNKAQGFINKNLPQLSPEAIEQISKGKGGLSTSANDLASTLGGFAPYIIPGMAGEGMGAKAATFATALATSLPDVKKQALDMGLTGKAFNTYLTAKPLVDAAFMSLLPSAKFAKGYEKEVGEAIVNGEFNSPKTMLLNLAGKILKDPADVAHLQAMLSGTELGNAAVNAVTNGLQSGEDLKKGIVRNGAPLSVDLSNIVNLKQTAVMAMAGKILETIPTVAKSIGDRKYDDVNKAYQNAQNNLVELAATNLEGVSKKVDELLKKNPSDVYTQHIKSTLQDFAQAEAKMPEGLEPEQKAALFEIQNKITDLKTKQGRAAGEYAGHIDKNIEELSKQIPGILKDKSAANKYLQDAHDDFVEQIQSPKTDDNGKTTDAQTQTEGQVSEQKTEGAEKPVSKDAPSPSIEPNEAFRTLDYGEHKGKLEDKDAKAQIDKDIVNDEPLGKSGDRFSDYLARVLPAFKKVVDEEPNHTIVVTHSSVIKALDIWEEMGRPDQLTPDMIKEFAKKYVELVPEKEGKVHTFKDDNGKEIKVVRHGETEDNKLSEFRHDDTTLTDKGQAQAKAAGEKLLKEIGPNHKIIASDLPRTMHTSDIIRHVFEGKDPEESSFRPIMKGDKVTSAHFEGEQKVINVSHDGKQIYIEGAEDHHVHEVPAEDVQRSKPEKDDSPFTEEPGDKSILATNEGSGETISTKRAVNDVIRDRMGLPEVPIPKLGPDSEEMSKAKARIDSGKSNPRDIVDKILGAEDVKDIGLSTNERYDMQYHMLQLKQHGMELNRAMEDVNEKLAADPADKNAQEKYILLTQQRAQHAEEYIRATTANRIGSAVWGQSGNAMQVEMDEKGQILHRIQRISDWYGGKLPDDVKAKLDEIQKNLEDANAKMQKLQEKYDQKVVENEALKALKGEVTKKTRKTSDQFKTERKQILGDIKDALRKARGDLSATIVPGAKELAAITPHLLKLFKSYAEEGFNKAEDVIGKMFDDVKDYVPGITKKDIHDILAGEYKESKKPIDKNEDYVKAQQAKANANMMLRKIEREAMDSKKNLYMKALDFATQWERRAIFAFNNAVFLKLGSAAIIGSTLHKPVEFAVGKVVSKAFPKIADQAIIEGNENLASLAKFYAEEFDPIKFGQQTWQIYKRGESGLTQELSQTGHVGYTYDKKLDYLKPILDVYTNSHQVIKDPIKRAVFQSSLLNALRWYRKNGMDPSHPLILEEARQYAYKRAEYEIFQNKNAISSKINGFIGELEKSGILESNEAGLAGKITGNLKYTVSTLYHMLVPIATVPINIVSRASVGTLLPYNIVKAFNMEKGIKEMKPEQADIVLRQLKKGAIGAAYWSLGLYLYGNAGGLWNKYDPDKKKSGQRDVDLKLDRPHADEIKTPFGDIPKGVQHAPQLQSLQFGATMANVYIHYHKELSEGVAKSVGAGIMAQMAAMLDDVPPAKETVKLLEGINDPKQLEKVGKDLRRGFGYDKLQAAGLLPPDAPKPTGKHQSQHR